MTQAAKMFFMPTRIAHGLGSIGSLAQQLGTSRRHQGLRVHR